MSVQKQDLIQKLRNEIDKIDLDILRLINERATIARRIGEIKRELGLPIFVPSREKEILKNIVGRNSGPLDSDSVEQIFQNIITICRNIQQPSLKVAYLGPQGTFTHLAALKFFSNSAEFIASSSVADVFKQVMNKECLYGVIPIENSLEGFVTSNLDLLIESDVNIAGEIILPIDLHLMSINTNIEEIKKIYSHKFGIAESRQWLAVHLPNVEIIEVESTAKAAEIVQNDKYAAAIASEYAAEIFGLHILYKKIDQHKGNYTRFLVIGYQKTTSTNDDKTSIVFRLQNGISDLPYILDLLNKNNIKLLKIVSRPSRAKSWDSVFLIDIQGHIEDVTVRMLIDSISTKVSYMKLLGSYAAACND